MEQQGMGYSTSLLVFIILLALYLLMEIKEIS